MSFQSETLCQNTDMIREIVVQIAKYSSDDIIITDEKFNVVFYNNKYMEEKHFLTLFDLISELLNEELCNRLHNFKISNNNHLYIKLIISDGNNSGNIPINIHFCKIKNIRNKVKGYIVVLQNIEQELRNKIQKETFIDIISHDLKNPMRANIQILELILKNKYGNINNELKNVLDELLYSCKFMKYMAENLVIKYKNEFEVYELNKRKYSIVKLVRDKCNMIMELLERKNQTIELILDNKIPDVFIDTDEMKKVIQNLIINASNEGKENSKIIIKISSDNNNVFVSLTDKGYSSNETILNNLFEEYISCSNKFRKIGFSLELYNCRRIIEAHGGNIIAKNLNNDGKIITFTLPILL